MVESVCLQGRATGRLYILLYYPSPKKKGFTIFLFNSTHICPFFTRSHDCCSSSLSLVYPLQDICRCCTFVNVSAGTNATWAIASWTFEPPKRLCDSEMSSMVSRVPRNRWNETQTRPVFLGGWFGSGGKKVGERWKSGSIMLEKNKSKQQLGTTWNLWSICCMFS